MYGGTAKFQDDPHWRDLILFYEYFHGDNGAGLGASHQTGWTGSIARLLDLFGRVERQGSGAGTRASVSPGSCGSRSAAKRDEAKRCHGNATHTRASGRRCCRPSPRRPRPRTWTTVFRKVSPSVVVVRSKGRDVSASGITRFNETGSGVLISSDGRVMTAAHVVNGMDEITVEGIGGEVVRANSSRPMRPPMSRSCSSSA